jgi:manganese/zinc/iron transport system substrate-binding protein
MDVSLWCKTVPLIVETLCMLAPECKDQIKKNGEKLIEELNCEHEKMKDQVHLIPEEKRYLVTTHDAFNYFTRAYFAEKEEIQNGSWQKRCMAPEGLAPESQLSTIDIHRLVEYLITHNVCFIFSEANVSQDSINKLIDASAKKGHFVTMAKRPLFADSMGPQGSQADSYPKMMGYDADVIVQAIMERPCIQH